MAPDEADASADASTDAQRAPAEQVEPANRPVDHGTATAAEPEIAGRSPEYLRFLLIILATTVFFEGYDGNLAASLLPRIQKSFEVSESALGLIQMVARLGAVVAFFIAAQADRWGRKRLLVWTVAGYTLTTAATAFAWDAWSFTVFQFGSQCFLGSEYAVAVTMIVEEYPAERRSRALATLSSTGVLGGITVGLLLFVGFATTSLDWRLPYLTGIGPLVLIAVLRRRVRETRYFQEIQEKPVEERRSGGNLFEVWKPEFRKILVAVGMSNFFRAIPVFAALFWWPWYAQEEAGLSEQTVGIGLFLAGILGACGYIVCGRLMERIGRRSTGMIYSVLATGLTIALFQVHGTLAQFALLGPAIFFGLGAGPVVLAFSTEPFPTFIRSRAAAWSRNGFEITGVLLGPAMVGVLGDHETGVLGSIGNGMSLVAVLMLVTTVIYWKVLPETKGISFEELDAAAAAVPPRLADASADA